MSYDIKKRKGSQANSIGFLAESNFGKYYRPFLPLLGCAGAVLLSELAQKFIFHSEELITDKKHGAGWFYHTIETIQERTGLTRSEQDTALKILTKNRLVRTQVFGLPPKRHFILNIKAIHRLYLDPLRENDTDNEEFAETANCIAKTENLIPDSYKFNSQNRQIQPLYTIEEKEEEKEEERPASNEACSADAERLSKKLSHAILSFKENFKLPKTLVKWSQEIDRMLRLDNVSIERIDKVLDWLPSDSFWRGNILSAEKLRQQFDRLEIAIDEANSRAVKQEEGNWIRTNTNTVFEYKRDNPDTLKHITIQGKYVLNNKTSKDLSLNQNPERFVELFCHIAEVKHA